MATRSLNPIPIVDLMHRDAPARHRIYALGFIGMFLAITVVAARDGNVQGPIVAAFVPICSTLWGIGDLLTAYLLFTQFSVNGIRAFALLGVAYTVPGLLTIAYVVFFPNVFFPSPLPAGIQQISVWLWLTWHAAFPVIVAAVYVADRALGVRIASGQAVRRVLGITVVASILGSAIAIALIVAGHNRLPVILDNGHFTGLYARIVVPLVVLTNLAAAAVVFTASKRPSTLQIWLTVALISAAMDGALNASSAGRYTLSWYIGKIETLTTATLVLMILLAEVGALYRKLGSMATIDGLTGVPNRQSFDADARWAIQVHARGASLAFVMLDIDFFKQFNDTYGHQAGDDCLRQVAECVRFTCTRSTDLVARYGGEEFVVLLSGTTESAALRIAEALRANVEALNIPHAKSSVAKVVTISVGVVHTDGGGPVDLTLLFGRADAALYTAKQTRNTVALADAVPLPTLAGVQ